MSTTNKHTRHHIHQVRYISPSGRRRGRRQGFGGNNFGGVLEDLLEDITITTVVRGAVVPHTEDQTRLENHSYLLLLC